MSSVVENFRPDRFIWFLWHLFLATQTHTILMAIFQVNSCHHDSQSPVILTLVSSWARPKLFIPSVWSRHMGLSTSYNGLYLTHLNCPPKWFLLAQCPSCASVHWKHMQCKRVPVFTISCVIYLLKAKVKLLIYLVIYLYHCSKNGIRSV